MAELGYHGAASSTTSTSLFTSWSVVGCLQTPGTDGLHGAGVLDLDLFLVNGEHGGGEDLLGQPPLLPDLHHHQDSQDDQDQTRHHCCESHHNCELVQLLCLHPVCVDDRSEVVGALGAALLHPAPALAHHRARLAAVLVGVAVADVVTARAAGAGGVERIAVNCCSL